MNPSMRRSPAYSGNGRRKIEKGRGGRYAWRWGANAWPAPVAVVVEEVRGDARRVVVDPRLRADVHERRGARLHQHVAQQDVAAVADGDEEVLVTVVVVVHEDRHPGDAVRGRVGADRAEGRDVDTLEAEVAEVAVEGVAVLRAHQGIRDEDVQEAVVVEVADGDGAARRKKPLRDVPQARIELVEKRAEMRVGPGVV